MAEIARLEALGGSEINEAKKVLATEATTLLHGRAAADEAAETARKTFEEGALAESLPTVEIERASLEAGHGLLSLFVTCGLGRFQRRGAGAMSRAARVRVNDEPVKDERRVVGLSDVGPEGVIKLSLGRKKHVLVRPV